MPVMKKFLHHNAAFCSFVATLTTTSSSAGPMYLSSSSAVLLIAEPRRDEPNSACVSSAAPPARSSLGLCTRKPDEADIERPLELSPRSNAPPSSSSKANRVCRSCCAMLPAKITAVACSALWVYNVIHYLRDPLASAWMASSDAELAIQRERTNETTVSTRSTWVRQQSRI